MPITNLFNPPQYEKNYIVNSNFDFWQRNNTFSSPSSGSYNADRWRVDHNGGTAGTFTVSRQAFPLGQTDVPFEPTYFWRWNQTVAGSGNSVRVVQQRIESVRTLAGKTITVSWYAKADASRTLGVSMNQFFGSGGSPSADVLLATQNFSLTTTWQKFTAVFAIPSIVGKTLGSNNNDTLDVTFYLPLNTTMTIDIAQVMVNEGPTAQPWQLNAGGAKNLAGELAICQRFYRKSYDLETAPGTLVGSGAASNGAVSTGTQTSGAAVICVQYAPMRNVPTFTIFNPVLAASGTVRGVTGNANVSPSIGYAGQTAAFLAFTATTQDYWYTHYTLESEL